MKVIYNKNIKQYKILFRNLLNVYLVHVIPMMLHFFSKQTAVNSLLHSMNISSVVGYFFRNCRNFHRKILIWLYATNHMHCTCFSLRVSVRVIWKRMSENQRNLLPIPFFNWTETLLSLSCLYGK